MASITQDMRFRKAVVLYDQKHGVTITAKRYKTNRQFVYRWLKRYDNSWDSLRYKSRRPHYHPNQHTCQEITLIKNMRKRNPHSGLVVFWIKLRQHGYKRSITGLYRLLRRLKLFAVKPKNPKYIPKPYEIMDYPGQRIQIDVKYVPAVCLVGKAKGQKFYQYTAIDEFSRWRFVEAFEEHNTYTSMLFIEHLIKVFPLPIECVQTDNGFEFPKQYGKAKSDKDLTIFQVHLKEHGIRHKQIRPFTPRHNGKVERSHRKDNERFYATHTFYSFDDFSRQLKTYNQRDYNNFPMKPLSWKSPNEVITSYLSSV